MRHALLPALFVCIAMSAFAQEQAGAPTDRKAQKTYHEGMDYLRKRQPELALDRFKKADKEDGGQCPACQREIVVLGAQLHDWKPAENAAEQMIGEAHGDRDVALARYQLGMLLFREGTEKHRDEVFTRAHEELTKALSAGPNFPEAVFLDGEVLAALKQDEAAKAQFGRFVEMKPAEDPIRQRALRFVERPDLARSRMAPPFTVTTLDGQRLSMDDLQGKVVLVDFWATWGGPCREALPHMREIANKFQQQPLVILSVSLDRDEPKWKDFVEKNGMTWPQYRDGAAGAVAALFGVSAIPHTFTIDADGVLQDEHVGDAALEGKLKKLISQARELKTAKQQGQ